MFKRLELPTVERPFVLILLIAFFCYVAVAAAMASTADSNAYAPHIAKGAPLIQYFLPGSAYAESFWVSDSDLMRPASAERLSLQVNGPQGFAADRVTLVSPISAGGGWIRITAPALPTRHMRLPVTILVTDAAGHREILTYTVFVSDPPLFSMTLDVRSTSKESSASTNFQSLTFGFGAEGTTTGHETGMRGALDTNYCEYELPPPAPIQVFDARWSIPSTTGTYWNFYPEGGAAEAALPPWSFTVNAGSTGLTENLPVVLAWRKQDAAAAPRTLYLSDPGGQLFRVNMSQGTYTTSPGVTVQNGADSVKVAISLSGMTQFKIEQALGAGVDDARADGAETPVAEARVWLR